MKLTAIATNRVFNNWPSWHLIHEWEDDFAVGFQVPFKSYREAGRLQRRVNNIIGKGLYYTRQAIPFLQHTAQPNKEKFLVFELTQKITYSKTLSIHKDAIPVIIDFFCSPEKLYHFYAVYQNCQAILISSLEAYNFLKRNSCPIPIYHFPLSISDRYEPTATRIAKTIDVVVAGRTSPVIWNYLQAFSAKYPDVEYVYRKSVRGAMNYYSNKSGSIGGFQSRAAFMDLLRSGRVAFYSTPGIDGGEARTAGFNPVTPRYLELLCAQCCLIGRYPDNEETRYYELPAVCPNITTYHEFEQAMLQYLNSSGADVNRYNAILEKHYTSQRVKLLKEIVSAL